MKKKIILFTLLTLVAYLVINNTINKNSFTKLKNYMSSENKFLIKKFFFPYKYISQLENEILQNKSRSPIHNVFFAVKKELDFKKSLNDFKTKEKKEVKLSNNKVLSKYELSNFFHAGINHTIPGSGYIDFHNNNLFVLSARGILGYSKNFDNEITFSIFYYYFIPVLLAVHLKY